MNEFTQKYITLNGIFVDIRGISGHIVDTNILKRCTNFKPPLNPILKSYKMMRSCRLNGEVIKKTCLKKYNPGKSIELICEEMRNKIFAPNH